MPLLEHEGKRPQIHPGAYVAPSATVCGDVTIGPRSRVMFGARLIATGKPIAIGECVIVMENSVVRSTGDHAVCIGDHCLVGPHAHLVGCILEDECFVATGASVFHGACLEKGCELRVNGVVHLKSRLIAGAIVPIGWVAVGNPARIFPTEQHAEIWKIQEPLDFPATAYGIRRDEADMRTITEKVAARLSSHRDDKIIS